MKVEPEELVLQPDDPVEVPPGVVLDKLEELLGKGRVLLRYQRKAGWGLNGKVDRSWWSFRVEANGACQFVDDSIWVTERSSDWAESELEMLERLRKEVLRISATMLEQPSALQPRACRRAVFAFHRGEYAKQHPSKAKPKAAAPQGGTVTKPPAPVIKAASAPGQAKAKVPPAQVAKVASAQVAKVASAPAKAPVQVAKVASAAGGPPVSKSTVPAVAKSGVAKSAVATGPAVAKSVVATGPAVAKSAVAKVSKFAAPAPKCAFVAKTAAVEKPGESKAQASFVQTNGGFAAFLGTVKARLLTQGGEKEKYRQFLAAVNTGTDDMIVKALAGHADLVAQYRRVAKPSPVDGSQEKGQSAHLPPISKGGQASAPTPSAEVPLEKAPKRKPPLPRLSQQPVNAEKEVLAPLRQVSSDLAVQLTRLAFMKRNARASVRTAMLGYVRQQLSEESAYREAIIVRGPPGVGKSIWALEQLRSQVGLSQDEELVGRMTHICSVDDSFLKFNIHGEEEYAFDVEELEMAYARNEARVQVAMEAGIHPIYIDNSHMQLWEMGAYVRMAQKAGYEVSVVAPDDIFSEWADVDALAERNNARPEARAVPREQLEELLGAFQAVPEGSDPLQAALAAQRPSQRPAGVKRSAPPPGGPPAKVAKVGGSGPRPSGGPQPPSGPPPAGAKQPMRGPPGKAPRPSMRLVPGG